MQPAAARYIPTATDMAHRVNETRQIVLIDSSLFVSAKSVYIPAPFDCIERGTLGVQKSLNQQKLPPVTGRPSRHCPCVLCMGGRASNSRLLPHSSRLRRPEGFLKLPMLGSHPQGSGEIGRQLDSVVVHLT